MNDRKLRMGMVGGGQGAFIGAVHRMAAAMDNEIELVAGAFSSSAERSKASGEELFLPKDRVYASYQEMIKEELLLPEDQRMDFVSIVTPNHMHFAPAELALKTGFHVICDKPLAFSLEEGKKLEKLLKSTDCIFALTHNYTGYPMVRQARHLIKEGKLGQIRKVVVEYPQGWLSTLLESTGQKQASWRTDPAKSGQGGSTGDIGTHAANLAEYITDSCISQVCADVSIYVEGRMLDDDANVLLRFDNGAKGILHCSQISVGEENALNIRVYGEKAGLEWHQQEPNSLKVKYSDRPTEIYRTGVGELSEDATAHTRLPAGHPEGYLEAFANIYRNFAFAIKEQKDIKRPDHHYYTFPGIEEGIRGMNFVEKVVESGKADQKWVDLN